MKYKSVYQLRQLVVKYQNMSISIDVLYPALQLITQLMQNIVDSPIHKFGSNHLQENLDLVVTQDMKQDEFFGELKKNLGSEAKSENGSSLLAAYQKLHGLFALDEKLYEESHLLETLKDKTDQNLCLSTIREILSSHVKEISDILATEKSKTYLQDPYYIAAVEELEAMKKRSRRERIRRSLSRRSEEHNGTIEKKKEDEKAGKKGTSLLRIKATQSF